jgi:ABC-type molybdate transport system ATPase subunit
LHALFDRIGRRQDQYRQARIARAQAAQHLQAGHLGQAQVQDQQVEILGGQGGIGFHAVLDAIGGIAGMAQERVSPSASTLSSSARRMRIGIGQRGRAG